MKTTLFISLLFLVQILSNHQFDSTGAVVAEVFLVLIAAMLGAGLKIGMKRKKKKITRVDAAWVMFIAVAVGAFVDVAWLFYDFNFPRFVAIGFFAFISERALSSLDNSTPGIVKILLRRYIGEDVETKE